MFKKTIAITCPIYFLCLSSFGADAQKASQEEDIDAVTLEPVAAPQTLPCGHTFNLSTLRNLDDAGHRSCPLCRAEFARLIPPEMLIFVSHYVEEKRIYSHTFYVYPKETLGMLKQDIEKRIGVPAAQLRLFFQGKKLVYDDWELVQDYKIPAEVTIVLLD